MVLMKWSPASGGIDAIYTEGHFVEDEIGMAMRIPSNLEFGVEAKAYGFQVQWIGEYAHFKRF